MKILMVLTSHEELGNTGEKTGFWLEEFAAPYYVFKDSGAAVILAAPKGGQPPLDPKSAGAEFQTAATARFNAANDAQKALPTTLRLRDVSPDAYDALFYPGGHGPLWDLVEDKHSINLIEIMFALGKPVAAVCHAPAVLLHARKADGSALVQGKAVTGFSNSEETAVGLTEIVPFLLEEELQKIGGNYSKGADWQAYLVRDGNLITGQNPASSEAAAIAVLRKSDGTAP
jgi:putative intracellular protease/amidase